MPSSDGALLVLAGSVLISAGIVTTTTFADVGFLLGGIVFVVGVAALLAGPLKRMWDAIPVDSPDDRQTSNEH